MKRFAILFAAVLFFCTMPAYGMVCLDNSDTLEGGASVDAVVDYTVHGMVSGAFTNIAQGQLSDTDPSVLYTAATDISIVSVIYVNTHSAAVTVNLYLDPTNAGTPRRMIPEALALQAGYSMVFDGQRCTVIDTNGGIVSGVNVSDTAYGAGWDTITTVAPSKNAIYDALAGGLVTPAFNGLSAGDANITNVGNIALDSISSDAGTTVNVDLGSDAGDDFTVDTDKLVVEGDTGEVGIGVANPEVPLHVYHATEGGARFERGDGQAYVQLYNLVATPADGTSVGYIEFDGKNDAGSRIGYAAIRGVVKDDAEGSADGYLQFMCIDDAVLEAKMMIDKDGNVGIGTDAPGYKLQVNGYALIGYATDGTVVGAQLTSQSWYSAGIILNDLKSDSADIRNWKIFSDAYTYGDLGFSVGSSLGAAPDTVLMLIQEGGNVGIGTTNPNQKLTVAGSISLVDQAAAAADTAGYGQIWVSNATPDELWFTDDAGTDTQISSHPIDAPIALYTNGPGLDWLGKRVQKYLGVIFWQKLDGTITEETFDAYNLRRKDVPGHTDLVKRDWNTVQLAKLREQKLKEVIETEVAITDAFEEVEITEDVQTRTKSEGFTYAVDKDGKVTVADKIVPIITKQGTGKYKKQLKSGVSFDEKTGTFTQKRRLTEAEVDALNLQPPEMPGWMKTWLLTKE